MLKTQYASDRVAMGLSVACVVHCFFAPTFIIFSLGISSFSIESELIHYIIILLAVPISSLALTIGYRHHHNLTFLITGVIGLSILVIAVLLGESLLGELGEQLLTLAGSMLVAFSHYKNYRTCKALECSCHDNQIY